MKRKEVYDVGDVIVLWVEPRDPDTEEPVEPEAMTCTVNAPNGTKTLPPVTKEKRKGGAIRYRADCPITESGTWRYAFDGTGKFQGSEEREFKVRPQKVVR